MGRHDSLWAPTHAHLFIYYALYTNGHHGQRPQEWCASQCEYYGSVKKNDAAALTEFNKPRPQTVINSRPTMT